MALEDDRHLVVNGRRWRRQDPTLPDDVRALLLSHLGRGRSGVRRHQSAGDADAVARARETVQSAKEGLGERGEPWWEQSPAQRRRRWETALGELARATAPPTETIERDVLDLLGARSPDKTICPSEVARRLHPDPGWRGLMPLVHAAVVHLAGEHRVVLRRRGQDVPASTVEDLAGGPIRVARGPSFGSGPTP